MPGLHHPGPGPARAAVVPLPRKDLMLKWVLVKVPLYPNTSGSQERGTISNRPRKYNHLSARSVSLAETFSAFAPNKTYINLPLGQESPTRRSTFCDTFLMAMLRTTN